MDVFPHSTLIIRSLVLGELDTNCYLLTDHQSGETIIIDPADSASTILDVITAEQLQATAIMLTHGHFDHCLGLLELQLALDMKAWMHQADAPLIATAQSSAQHWLGHQVDPVPTQTQPLEQHSQLQLGNHQLTVLHTPGHTPGSICLLITHRNEHVALITGDTLFKNSVGRTDFSYSKPLQLRKSLDQLLELPDQLACYPGHGEPTTIASAKAFLS